MKICIIAEGSYPYVTGGVSSWIQMLISNMKEHEFIIYAIGAEEKDRGHFRYEIPQNVIEVREVFLDSFLKYKGKYGKKFRLNNDDKNNLKEFIKGSSVDWYKIFELIKKINFENIMDFFMCEDFYNIIKTSYIEKYSLTPFTEYFWTIRSMIIPLFLVVMGDIPEADLYHSVSTGYAGVVGSLGKFIHNKPYVLTEHGIYSREREEEIIKSDWILGYFKDNWIKFFYQLSNCAYSNADKVVTLFNKNKEIEMELGCKESKIEIIPNGVDVNKFKDIELKDKNDMNINIGAIIRVVPIKDIKTMIQSFSIVKSKIVNAKFFIMGPTDEDEEYFHECKELMDSLQVKGIIFTGRVNIKEYLGKMDILVLTSISEGQPLAILEGAACRKPFVSTNVGSCRELLYGSNDKFGCAGIVVPVMNFEKIAGEIIELCNNKGKRKEMGNNAYRRVSNLYTMDNFIGGYKRIYSKYKDKVKLNSEGVFIPTEF